MDTQHLLDVRVIEPGLKHLTIFQRFDGLKTGEKLTIVNDHDPVPLYYQFKAERPDQFEWNYVEKGPETWKVTIARVSGTRTVADILLDNPRAAGVFKKYRIDFCCKGSRPLEEACTEAGIDTKTVLEAIDQATENPQHDVRASILPQLQAGITGLPGILPAMQSVRLQ